MAANYLCSTAELEQVVGTRPAASQLKSINHLDAHCATLLAASTLTIVGVFPADDAPRLVATGGPSGTAAIAEAPGVLALPELPDLEHADGAPAGLLALVPGFRETLRVNGRLRIAGGAHVEVEEAFLHCAKAIIRSRFWDEPATPSAEVGSSRALDATARAFLDRAPFVALASVDCDGRADVSPKGDPAGFVRVLDDATIAVPDRPGNRRTDTMHNVVDRSELALLAFVPGDSRVLEVCGRARVTDDADLCAGSAVNGKAPKAMLVIDVDRVELRGEPAIAAAALWDASAHVTVESLPRPSRIWVDHVKLNEAPGLAAKAMRAAVNEKALAAGLRRDYSHNLY